MPRWLICVLAVLAAPLAAGPSMAAGIEALEVVDVGLYHAQTTGHIPSPQAVNGRTQTIADIVFYSSTSKVPAKQGIRFGTRFRVIGAPASRAVTLRSVWRIPEPGIRNPETGIVYRQSSAEFTTTIGALYMRGFNFASAWQILCGDWIQEVWFGARKLLSQTFTVEDCQSVPTAARRAAAPAG
jgi:hypothetical protein